MPRALCTPKSAEAHIRLEGLCTLKIERDFSLDARNRARQTEKTEMPTYPPRPRRNIQNMKNSNAKAYDFSPL